MDYIFIPASIRYDSSLTASEKLLFSEILTTNCEDDKFNKSNAELAQEYGCTERAIQTILQKLEKKGLITREIVYQPGKNGKKVIGRNIYADQKMVDDLSKQIAGEN